MGLGQQDGALGFGVADTILDYLGGASISNEGG
jgi:hypothetical protein